MGFTLVSVDIGRDGWETGLLVLLSWLNVTNICLGCGCGCGWTGFYCSILMWGNLFQEKTR